MKQEKIILWPLVFYIAAQLIANVSSIKVGLVLSYAVDMGVFIYPITFTLRDLVHRTLGKKMTRDVVILTGAANLFLALYLWFIGFFPAVADSLNSANFDSVMAPIWRLVIASIAAQIISELLDTEIYHRLENKARWVRVLLSNAASVPVDNVIFCLGAFWLLLPFGTIVEIFVFNLVVKYAISALSVPLIYTVKAHP